MVTRRLSHLVGILLTASLVGLLTLACDRPIEKDPEPSQATKAEPLELEKPITASFAGADSTRHRYIVKIGRSGLLTFKLSWNNPDGINRAVIQRADGSIDTLDARTKQEITHQTRADAGFYYIELVPGPAPISYNLVVSLQ